MSRRLPVGSVPWTMVAIGCAAPSSNAANRPTTVQDMVAPVQPGPIQTQAVAAGVDATVDVSQVTTDPNGDPWDGFHGGGDALGHVYATALTAADAQSECDATGCYFDWDAGEVTRMTLVHDGILRGDQLPDGGATLLEYTSYSWSEGFTLELLLLPAANEPQSTITLTADDWLLVVQ